MKPLKTSRIVKIYLLGSLLCLFASGYIAWRAAHRPPMYPPVNELPPTFSLPPVATSTKPVIVVPRFPIANTKVVYDTVKVTAASAPVFAYAHGIAEAAGKFFIGMTDQSGNTFAPNQITVFPDPSDLAKYSTIALREPGAVEDMEYDPVTDTVYFIEADIGKLLIGSVNPHTFEIRTIISTTTLDTGRRPAIVTDGIYIYGITNTSPSTVFRVKISDGSLTYTSSGHIKNGHSASIGIYSTPFGTSTELYFGGGMKNGFEKTDADTLRPIATVDLGPCALSNDQAFVQESPIGGFVYAGCELYPYGFRIHTADMKVTQFPLPGKSFGMFSYGGNLFGVARDGSIDVFPGMNIENLYHHVVMNTVAPVDTHNQSLEINELFFDPASRGLFYTAWWGVPGLFRIDLPQV